jgi:tight adherence protein C
MILILLLALVLAGSSVALMLRALAGGRIQRRAVLAQIGSYGFGAGAVTPRRSGLDETIAALALRIGSRFERRVGASRLREMRKMLNAGGFYRTSTARYLGYRLIAAVVLPLAFFLLFALAGSLGPRAIFAVGALAGVGWVAPPFYVRRRARTRLEKIDYEVPELVDLLVATVEAGVGFVAALQISAQRVREPLGEELRLTLREQSFGLTMDEALRNLVQRADSPALRLFVQAILQGETLGVSIGKILRDLAVDMRKRRRQAAEERAQKAPIKLLFPLVLLILPSMFIIILGPAVYAIGKQFGGG